MSDAAALQKLLTWLSPAFPVGAFAWSAGLESAIAEKAVTDSAGLQNWIGGNLAHGGIRTDAILVAQAWDSAGGRPLHHALHGPPPPRSGGGSTAADSAVGTSSPVHAGLSHMDLAPESFCFFGAGTRGKDCIGPAQTIAAENLCLRSTLQKPSKIPYAIPLPVHGGGGPPKAVEGAAPRTDAMVPLAHTLTDLAELCLALTPAAERHKETLLTGEAFTIAARAWPSPIYATLPQPCPYPIAVGAVASAHGIGLEETLLGYLTAAVHAQISVAVRLVPLGQTDGLRVMAALEPEIAALATAASTATLAELGSIAYAADIAQMRHETLEPRIFRS